MLQNNLKKKLLLGDKNLPKRTFWGRWALLRSRWELENNQNELQNYLLDNQIAPKTTHNSIITTIRAKELEDLNQKWLFESI